MYMFKKETMMYELMLTRKIPPFCPLWQRAQRQPCPKILLKATASVKS